MPRTSLHLDRPIPRDSIELGRLVLDPKYPNLDFCQPSHQRNVTTQHFENFYETLGRVRGTGIELNLLGLLSIAPSAPKKSLVTVTGPLCVIHQLHDAGTYFSNACRESHVRRWLEEQLRRPHNSVYIVCGFKALTDAQVKLSRSSGTDVEASVTAPIALITAAAGTPLPIPLGMGLDIGAGISVNREKHERVGYTATGENVFEVQYRKIHVSWFSTNKVDKAYLERKNRWKSYISTRAADSNDDGVDVEVGEPIALSDLMGEYESIEVGGDEILYRVLSREP